MLVMPPLRGERCILRELRSADAASLREQADDEAVWRNMFEGWPRPYTQADANQWCGGAWRSAGHVWGIEVDGQIVGCIGLRQEAGWLRCNAEFGYWIGQPFWRRGIVSEALRLVTAWAWVELPEITRLYAPIFAWNEGSQAVARSCGYQQEARMPQSAIKAGRVIDRIVWAAYRQAATIES